MLRTENLEEELKHLSESPAVEWGPALARLSGSRELMIQMTEFFLEDGQRLLQQVGSCIANHREKLSAAAHSLRGVCATFEARPVMEVTHLIERQADQLTDEQLTLLWTSLQVEFGRLCDAIADYRRG